MLYIYIYIYIYIYYDIYNEYEQNITFKKCDMCGKCTSCSRLP